MQRQLGIHFYIFEKTRQYFVFGYSVRETLCMSKRAGEYVSCFLNPFGRWNIFTGLKMLTPEEDGCVILCNFKKSHIVHFKLFEK